VSIDPLHGIITGGGQFSRNWNPAPYGCFFAAELSKPPENYGTWNDATIQKSETVATAKRKSLGVFAQWKTRANEVVYLKIAVSFVSVAKATEYLHDEIPEWGFETTQSQARSRWEKALSTIEISDAGRDQQRIFYTALYHALIQPRDRSGDHP